jgi:hypothetical protein
LKGRSFAVIGVAVILITSISLAFNQDIKLALGLIDDQKAPSDGFGIPAGIRHYSMMKASCNNSTGHPDGECFMKFFEKCESARIKQMVSTIEGDPIFFYATIIPEDSCSIQFVVDDREDKFGSQTITERTCQDAKLLENDISFQCGNDIDSYGFPLR